MRYEIWKRCEEKQSAVQQKFPLIDDEPWRHYSQEELLAKQQQQQLNANQYTHVISVVVIKAIWV